MGTDPAAATTLMENGSPASFNESDPLTGGEANVPAAVKITFGPVSGIAPLDPEARNQDIAANAAIKEAFLPTVPNSIGTTSL
jgi:hypothetical protein